MRGRQVLGVQGQNPPSLSLDRRSLLHFRGSGWRWETGIVLTTAQPCRRGSGTRWSPSPGFLGTMPVISPTYLLPVPSKSSL